MKHLKEERQPLKEELEPQASEYCDDEYDDDDDYEYEYDDEYDDEYEYDNDDDDDDDDDDDYLYKYDLTHKVKVKKESIEAHKRLQDVLFERELAQIDRDFFDIY